MSRVPDGSLEAVSSHRAWRTRHHCLAAGLLAVIVLCGGAARLVPGVTGVTNDDGIYVATAKALAEGRGYHLIGLPGEPPQTKYPILYPAVLSFIWMIRPAFPANVVAMQALSLLAAALAVALAYLYFVRFRYFSPGVAFGGCALCATSPTYLYFATATLSEMTFAVLVVLAFWKVDGLLEAAGTLSDRRSFTTGVLAALPALCRTVGLSLLAVFASLVALRRKDARAFLTGAGLLLLPWVIWSAQNWGLHNSSEGYYTDYVGWWAESSQYLPRIAAQNIFWLIDMTSRLPLEGLSASLWRDSSIVFLAFGMATWIYIALSSGPTKALFLSLIGYGAILVVWPWPPTRFLVPLLAFLGACLITTPDWLARRLVGRYGSRLVFAGVLLACAMNLASLNRLAHDSRRHSYPMPDGVFAAKPPMWASFQALFQWLELNTGRDDILASGFDSMLYLYTGRVAWRPWIQNPAALYYRVPAPPLGTVDMLATTLTTSHTMYIVQTPMFGSVEEAPIDVLIRALQANRPGCVTERYRQPDDRRFAVFRVNADRCADAPRSGDQSAAPASRDRR